MRSILVGLLLLPAAIKAGGVLDSSVSHRNATYWLSVDACIDAPISLVHRLITDYDHLDRVNPSVVTSEVLKEYSPQKHRVRTVTRVCVLFYCRDVTQVQDMEKREGQRIEAKVLPHMSDFKLGAAYWHLTGNEDYTLMRFRAEIVPDFFIPPLIGTWLIRRELDSQIGEIVRIVESLAEQRNGA